MAETPHVFISATSSDLQPYRAAAKQAILDAGCYPRTMEHFPGQDYPPYHVCIAEVGKSDVVVAIVAHRYGWVPLTKIKASPGASANMPAIPTSKWIRHYLAAQNWDLDEAFLEAKLREKETALLLNRLRRHGQPRIPGQWFVY